VPHRLIAPARFALPRRLRGAAAPKAYDVVLAGDWTAAGGAARAGVGRIRSLTARGLRVALLQLDVLVHLRHDQASLDADLQDLINAGTVQQVELDDDLRVRLVVAQSAGRAQPCPGRLRLSAQTRSSSRRPRPRRLRHAPGAGSSASNRCGHRPDRPAGEHSRDARGVPLATVDLPGTVDAAAWRLDRRGARADRPVVGRCCHGGRDEWRRLYAGLPDPGRVDVRLLDGTGAAARAFGRSGPPHGWLIFTPADVSVRSFLYQLDYYLPLPTAEQHTDPDPEVLQALAAGCVAVLPPPFAETFGDAAVYCAPDETADTVRAWHGRRPRAARAERARARILVRRQHSPGAVRERIANADRLIRGFLQAPEMEWPPDSATRIGHS
jgi:hypothetical protein